MTEDWFCLSLLFSRRAQTGALYPNVVYFYISLLNPDALLQDTLVLVSVPVLQLYISIKLHTNAQVYLITNSILEGV